MDVRPFCNEDHDAVVALWREVFPNAPPRNDPVLDIARKLDVQPELFLVAVVDGRVAGTVMAGFDGHRGWVHLVAVDPRYQRRGVGSALMRRAEALLDEMGCPKLNLQVRPTTPEVVGFYESLGFQVEERISMGKILSGGRR
jgi:ribosomal protein S18 acetylase RimI-like enzyme